MTRRSATLAAAAVMFVCAAGPARAATVRVTVEPGSCGQACDKYGGGAPPIITVRVDAAAGETNRITAALTATGWTVRDAGAPLTAGDGCRTVGDHVECGATRGPLSVTAGDGDDTVTATLPPSGPTWNVTLDGGAGNDRLEGGRGDDALDGGGGQDTLLGATGDDRLDDGDGRAGDADVFDGGPGSDIVDYQRRTSDLLVALRRDEGGDGDRLTSVEGVWSGSGDDTLIGDGHRNELAGGRGRDTLIGGNGADYLWGERGPDTLLGEGGDDQLYGEGGRDALRGARGDDRLSGGNDPDRIDAGRGWDEIGVSDGRADRVQCGRGRDVIGEDIEDPDSEYSDAPEYLTLGPDADDALSRDCERARVDYWESDVEDELVGTVPVQPVRVRPELGAVVFTNPCRDICRRGTVIIRAGSHVIGRADFGREERRIQVPATTDRWSAPLRVRWVVRTNVIGTLRTSFRVMPAR